MKRLALVQIEQSIRLLSHAILRNFFVKVITRTLQSCLVTLYIQKSDERTTVCSLRSLALNHTDNPHTQQTISFLISKYRPVECTTSIQAAWNCTHNCPLVKHSQELTFSLQHEVGFVDLSLLRQPHLPAVQESLDPLLHCRRGGVTQILDREKDRHKKN